MCISIHISDGREIDTLGELRRISPELVFHDDAPYDSDPADHSCLCWVDIPATLKGWTLDFPDHGMFVTATPPPCPACEAAQNDVRLMQARLQRLIDAEPQRELADLRARLEALADEWNTEARYDGAAASIFDACADQLRALLRKEAKQ